MVILFVCVECGKVFSHPVKWKEDRGEYFGFPAYEEYWGSPCCYEDYVEAKSCDECGEWITDDYFKIGNQRYCQNCCRQYELGEE